MIALLQATHATSIKVFQERDVQVLRYFITMCAACKQVRDDSGCWNNMDVSLMQHVAVDFSHTICPSCTILLYPDLFDNS